MAMTKAQKNELVDSASAQLKNSSIVILTGFGGIDVETDTKLRSEIRRAGGKYRVLKNTLAKRVLSEAKYAKLHGHMKGETAYVFGGEDPVAVVKVVTKFAKDHGDHFSLKSGFFEGNVLDAAQLKDLASIPPREELLQRLVNVLASPIQGLVNVLQGPLQKLAGTIQAVADKMPAEAPKT